MLKYLPKKYQWHFELRIIDKGSWLNFSSKHFSQFFTVNDCNKVLPYVWMSPVSCIHNGHYSSWILLLNSR